MKRRQQFGLFMFVCIAFVGSFILTLWRVGGWHVARYVTPSTVLHIAPDAELVRTYVLDDGTRAGSVVSFVKEEWVGLSSAEFAALHPQWDLLSFSPQQLVVAELCSFEDGIGFIRLENGQPTLYEGRTDGCYRRRGALAADVSGMSPLLYQELMAGVTYDSLADLSIVLEGLRAP